MTTREASVHEAPAERLAQLDELRLEVRELARAAAARGDFVPAGNSMAAFDREMSRRLAARGFAGTNIPERFGGSPRSVPEQWVIAEELLAAGVPLAAHWVCDRQIARMLLRFGTPEIQERLLPRMARGEIAFALGMSEPGSGSDLASVRTRARRTEGGWLVTGQKIWTSIAHRAEHCLVLCRTEESEDRHGGLSQIVVDLHAGGVDVRRIATSDGTDDFCEVFFDDTFAPDENLVGTPGSGWQQITTELSFERAWPDRYLTNLPVLEAFRNALDDDEETLALEVLGRLSARLASIRGLSWQAVALAEAQRDASATAALAKDAGTTYEQALLEAVRVADRRGLRHAPGPLRAHLRRGAAQAPIITIRGGTSEILRGIIAKKIAAPVFKADERTIVEESVEEILAKECTTERLTEWDARVWAPELWSLLVELGFAGGLSGGAGTDGEKMSLADVCAVLRLTGYHAAPVPAAEAGFLAAWLLDAVGAAAPAGGFATVAPVRRCRPLMLDGDGTLSGTASGVPYASAAESIVALAHAGDAERVVVVPASACAVTPADRVDRSWGDDVDFTGVEVAESEILAFPSGFSADGFWHRGAFARAVQIAGAQQRAVDLAVHYAHERKQFGRPIAQFQAVRDHLAVAAREVALARAAVQIAIEAVEHTPSFEDEHVRSAVAVAKAVTSQVCFEVSARVHQVHGAMGTTREHPLHFVTSRLAAWRDDFGDESEWFGRIGLDARSAPTVWDFVTKLEVVR